MAERDPAELDHPLEEWSDAELLDQLRYVRAEFADMDTDTDEDASPEGAIAQEIRRRGLDVPEGEDLDTPGRAEGR